MHPTVESKAQHGESQNSAIAERLTHFNRAINASWGEYYQLIQQLPAEYAISSCLKLLDHADRLLNREAQSIEFGLKEMYLLGGISDKSTIQYFGVDVGLLGDMTALTNFKKLLKKSPSGIKKLLNIIPANGPIDGWHYLQFCDSYRAIFAEIGVKQPPLFAATRLLSMKRPDQFMALNQQTASFICQALAIKPLKNQDLQRYWDQIILPLKKSSWFSGDLPMDIAQQALHRARVALFERLICTSPAELPTTSAFTNESTAATQATNQSIAYPSSYDDGFANPPSELIANVTHSQSQSKSQPQSAYGIAGQIDSRNADTALAKAARKPAITQPKKLTIKPRKSAKLNKNAATKLMSQYYFANKAQFAKVDMAANRDQIIERLIQGESVEQAFAAVISG